MSLSIQGRNRFAEPMEGVGLVTEGGGQRGAFTAGVLDSWQVARFNPFEILIGTSAGAQNIASFLSQQVGYAYSLISDLTTTREFFNPWRAFTGNNVLDLDWYFNMAEERMYQFDAEVAQQNALSRKVRFSASDIRNFSTQLIDPLEVGWLESLRLSSAIPYLYRSKSLVDGGVTAPIPVIDAHQAGAEVIVVIRTATHTHSPIQQGLHHIKPLLCRAQRCPEFIRLVDEHETAYSEAEAFMQSPPQGVRIFEIRPEKPLATRALGSSKAAVMDDYKYGFLLGQRFLESKSSLPFGPKQ